MSFKIENLTRENKELQEKYSDLSNLYLEASLKMKKFQEKNFEAKISELNKLIDEESEKCELEHKKYVFCLN